MDPEYFAKRVSFIDLPWRRADVLDPEVKHLLSIAIDAVSPQHYIDGLRKHIREALQIGVTPAAVFEVLGDGKRLWESAPVRRAGEPQQCRVAVEGVDVLELRVRAEGSYWSLHAVWLEPRLLAKPA